MLTNNEDNNVPVKNEPKAWGAVKNKSLETMNFAEIMKEEHTLRAQNQKMKRQKEKGAKTKIEAKLEEAPSTSKTNMVSDVSEWEDYSALLQNDKPETHSVECNSDAVIAQMLQSQFDDEYNQELRRVEGQRNKQSKLTVILDKFQCKGDVQILQDNADGYEEEEEDEHSLRDWDRFDTNEKLFDTIPKCGFKWDNKGEMITKHDSQLCGVRNACRVMSFPPEFPTGDGAGFDMKLSNQVFNQLKTYSHRSDKKNKMQDRKCNKATAEMGMDAPTRLLLFKLINKKILGEINGIISTGKEAIILHANSDPKYSGNYIGHGTTLLTPQILPKECAVKIFKTTLNEFKQRYRYIKDDYRFKDRFGKQNNRIVVNMWAEKEMRNIMRMQKVKINCPEVVMLKKHVLVMSFIGNNHNAAPKLKHARLSEAELNCAYEEIVGAMYKLYNEAKLVHADLSEYNILWHDSKCWFIDVAQSVEPEHPNALEFLMRDCNNIITFFKKRGVPNVYTKEELFQYITALNAEMHDADMLERIHTRGASVVEATAPSKEKCTDELKSLEYPFEMAWEKSVSERRKRAEKTTINNASTAISSVSLNKCMEGNAIMQQNKSI